MTARGRSTATRRPQLHTHVVIFNVTETADGTVRALQPRELYKTQQYGTAVYRSELAARLTALGYEIERGRSGQPEIRGYSRAYLDASSPRRQQIQDHLAEADRQGAAAAQIAAHQTREAKVDASHEEMQNATRPLAERFGNQPAQVVEAAEQRHVHTWSTTRTGGRRDRPSRSRATGISSAKPSWTNGRSCATRSSDRSGTLASRTSSRRSIAGSSEVTSSPSRTSKARQVARSPRPR